MKQLFRILFSTRLTLILLLIYTVALGVATFIEDAYDTTTAKMLIYNARWMEVVLLLLAVNFIGNISEYKMLKKENLSGFIFHAAFIVLIIGGAISRYTGFEGNMRIREGKSSNIIYSSEPYLRVIVLGGDESKAYDMPLNMSELTDNSFHLEIDSDKSGSIEIDYHDYVKNAIEKIVDNVDEGGENIIELTVAKKGSQGSFYIQSGEIRDIGDITVAYNNYDNADAIVFADSEDKLTLCAPYDLVHTQTPEMIKDTILKDSIVEFIERHVYNSKGMFFAYSRIYKNAKKQLVTDSGNEDRANALVIEVSHNDIKKKVQLFGGRGYNAMYKEFEVDGITLKAGYGNIPIELPFSIYLEDFILERYAGSMSPSSFASEVVLMDERVGLKKPHRIFMNNVLDYDGYRFFQSSYDTDEKGTILSVNHDFWGTWVSYFGYLLLGIGFIFILLNRNSRFIALSRKIKKIRIDRKAGLMIALIFGLQTFGFTQDAIQKPVSIEQAEQLGRLITQSHDGRFEPIHTLAIDVMHKISRKDKFYIEGKGTMTGMQVFLDMIIDSEFWKKQQIIYIRENSVKNVLGINSKYASFNDFFDDHGHYKLATIAEHSFEKKQSEQNRFDKEVIKVDERVNICMMVFKASMMKIFPAQNSDNNKWISWDDSLAYLPLTGSIQTINEDLQLANLNYHNFLVLYFKSVLKSIETGDKAESQKLLGYLDNIQRQSSSGSLLPTKKMVEFEIYNNKAQIFVKLKNWYALLSLILFVLAFIDNLRVKKSRIIRAMIYFFVGLLGVAFIYHTYGMGLRWYLTGHAPWSNGYEALLLVAWSGLLAGFCFIRGSKISIAATALLAFFILMTAGHSSYDPQLTNLQPVLKSYWLIIHVATITISYGFFGLAFIVGIVNLLLYLFKTTNNTNRVDSIIKELTCINEMNITIGLFLAVIGTFLGGIWANESWGRYWGWDAKETWALIIVLTYTIILHLRFIPKLRGEYVLNVASVLGIGSVLMTFIGVNYYLSKGLHSYASGDTPVFPGWAWGIIISLIILMVVAGVKDKLQKS